jgi:hypothetical protein
MADIKIVSNIEFGQLRLPSEEALADMDDANVQYLYENIYGVSKRKLSPQTMRQKVIEEIVRYSNTARSPLGADTEKYVKGGSAPKYPWKAPAGYRGITDYINDSPDNVGYVTARWKEALRRGQEKQEELDESNRALQEAASQVAEQEYEEDWQKQAEIRRLGRSTGQVGQKATKFQFIRFDPQRPATAKFKGKVIYSEKYTRYILDLIQQYGDYVLDSSIEDIFDRDVSEKVYKRKDGTTVTESFPGGRKLIKRSATGARSFVTDIAALTGKAQPPDEVRPGLPPSDEYIEWMEEATEYVNNVLDDIELYYRNKAAEVEEIGSAKYEEVIKAVEVAKPAQKVTTSVFDVYVPVDIKDPEFQETFKEFEKAIGNQPNSEIIAIDKSQELKGRVHKVTVRYSGSENDLRLLVIDKFKPFSPVSKDDPRYDPNREIMPSVERAEDEIGGRIRRDRRVLPKALCGHAVKPEGATQCEECKKTNKKCEHAIKEVGDKLCQRCKNDNSKSSWQTPDPDELCDCCSIPHVQYDKVGNFLRYEADLDLVKYVIEFYDGDGQYTHEALFEGSTGEPNRQYERYIAYIYDQTPTGREVTFVIDSKGKDRRIIQDNKEDMSMNAVLHKRPASGKVISPVVFTSPKAALNAILKHIERRKLRGARHQYAGYLPLRGSRPKQRVSVGRAGTFCECTHQAESHLHEDEEDTSCIIYDCPCVVYRPTKGRSRITASPYTAVSPAAMAGLGKVVKLKKPKTAGKRKRWSPT